MRMLPVGRGRCLAEGEGVAVLSIGTTCGAAADAVADAAAQGVRAAHYDMRFVRPLDCALLDEIGSRFDRVVTVEDGMLRGGVGEAVTAYFNRRGYGVRVTSLGVGDQFVEHGTPAELYRLCGYDREGILNAVIQNSEFKII